MLRWQFCEAGRKCQVVTIWVNFSERYEENIAAADKGGRAAGAARVAFEQEHGRKVISDESYLAQRKRLQSGAAANDSDETAQLAAG
jgi:hypothetical protein